MSRFSIIDPNQLPAMVVIVPTDSEATLVERMTALKTRWTEYDPPMGAQYDVEGLEFDPIKINQEVNTDLHVKLEDRVNQAARALTLVHAIGGDLDAIASRYPGGVPRATSETYDVLTTPLIEQRRMDNRYRRRIWLAANAFSTAGAEEAYVFHALTAVPTLKDASAVLVHLSRYDQEVVVTLMADRPDPKPTTAEIEAARSHLHKPTVKPLTAVVRVAGVVVINTKYVIDITLLPAIDETSIMAQIRAAVDAHIEAQRVLGGDHTLAAIYDAAFVPGVHNVRIREPVADILVNARQAVRVTEVELRMVGRAE